MKYLTFVYHQSKLHVWSKSEEPMSSSQVVWLAHTEYSYTRTRTQMVTTVLVSPPLLSSPTPLPRSCIILEYM